MYANGYYGIGVYHTKNPLNIGTLWRSANCFGASYIFTVGRRYSKQGSDTLKTYTSIPLFHYMDVDDLVAHLPRGCRLVGVEITPEAKQLNRFSHPEQACYLLGAEDHGLNKATIDMCHSIVQIPGASSCLNVAVAGSIIMYDRVMKGGNIII